jgi:hypothetical protein
MEDEVVVVVESVMKGVNQLARRALLELASQSRV